jgi:hypothetical protein
VGGKLEKVALLIAKLFQIPVNKICSHSCSIYAKITTDAHIFISHSIEHGNNKERGVRLQSVAYH